MADENAIDILLRFLVDQNSQKKAQEAIQNLGTPAAGKAAGITTIFGNDAAGLASSLNQTMKDLGVSAAEAAGIMAQMNPELGKTGEQILADVQAFEQMSQAAGQTAQNVQKIETNTRQAARGIGSMAIGMTGFVISMTGMQIQKMGEGILSPIQTYTKYAGYASGISAQWLESQGRLEQATLRIGAALSTSVAPTMEKIAGAAETVANLIERYPTIAKAATAFAGGSLVIGSLLMVGGQILSGVSSMAILANTIKTSTAAAGAASGAATTGAATAATAAGASAGIGATIGLILPYVLAGVVLTAVAAAVISFINQTELGKKIGEAQNQAASTGQSSFMHAEGYYPGASANLSQQYTNSKAQLDQLNGSVNALGNTSQNAAGKVDQASSAIQSQQVIDAYVAYQQQETQAAQQYEQQRLEIINSYGQQRADAEQQYEAQRAQIIQNYQDSLAAEAANYARDTATAARNYYHQEVQYEQDYYRNRVRLAQSYSLEVQRAEEDHQRRMLQMQQDHNLRVSELLDQQDAFGLLSEMRSYEKNRGQAESDYAVESRRRSEDFTLRMQEMEQQFSYERARRQQEYAQQRAEADAEYALRQQQRAKQMEQQLKELDQNHKVEMDRLAKQEQEKLNQLQQQYAQEEQARFTAFGQQLRNLNAYLGQETQLRAQYYAYWTEQFKAFMAGNLDALQSASYGTRASGGYASYGLYKLGDEGGGPGPEEYVMNGGLTRLAEKLAGGRLSNAKMATLLMGGAGGSSTQISINQRVDGRVSAADRRWMRDDVSSMLLEALSE